MTASQFQHPGHQAGKIQLCDLRSFVWPCQGWRPIGGLGWWHQGHLGSHTQGFTRVAGVPDLTQKLQTGTMAVGCLIWLCGTQGVTHLKYNIPHCRTRHQYPGFRLHSCTAVSACHQSKSWQKVPKVAKSCHNNNLPKVTKNCQKLPKVA